VTGTMGRVVWWVARGTIKCCATSCILRLFGEEHGVDSKLTVLNI
jgi:hypothetical protein